MNRVGFMRAMAVALVFAFLQSTSSAQQAAPRVVLKGHDPVAYFLERKPVQGNPKISYDWDDGRYYFASAKNRDLFVADPDRYAPQFGGYCTGSMSGGVRNVVDPEAWTIVDGRLYVFGNIKFKHIADKDPDWVRTRLASAGIAWDAIKK